MVATSANDRLQTPCLIEKTPSWREDPLPLDDGNHPGLADFCRLWPDAFPGGNKGSLQGAIGAAQQTGGALPWWPE
jgi:hypothetical protein